MIENPESPHQEISENSTVSDPFSRKMGCGFLVMLIFASLAALIAGLAFSVEIGDAALFFAFSMALLFVAVAGLIMYKIDVKKLFGSFELVKNFSPLLLLTLPLIFCSFAIMLTKILLVYGIIPNNLMEYLSYLDSSAIDISDTLTSNILMFITIVILAPVAEEILFRGVLFSRWARLYSPQKAAVYSSLIFGVLHANVIGLFFVGWALCMIYMYTKSLWLPILIHMLNNLLALYFYQIDFMSMSELSPEMVTKNYFLMLFIAVSGVMLAYYLYIRLAPASQLELPYDAN